MTIPQFELNVLQSISGILGDTQKGFTGSEISDIFSQCHIPDLSLATTNRIRLFENLRAKQSSDKCGNGVAAFIQHSMNPARHYDKHEWFVDTVSKLNHVLAFSGFQLGENGELCQTTVAETHAEATARASKLREHLISRKVHSDILLYCKEELLVDVLFSCCF